MNHDTIRITAAGIAIAAVAVISLATETQQPGAKPIDPTVPSAWTVLPDVDAVDLRQDGRTLAAVAKRSGEEHVGIELRDGSLAAGRAQLVLRYHGPLDPVSTQGLFRESEGGEWYVVSQFEAVSARRAVP